MVYQTLLPWVVEVPKPSLSASVQIAFSPGAPGAEPEGAAPPGFGPAVVPTKTIARRTAIPTNKRSPIGKRPAIIPPSPGARPTNVPQRLELLFAPARTFPLLSSHE